jgi:sarcosine oxidase subunit gamma
MADPAPRSGPLDARAAVRVAPLPPATRFVFRGGEDARAAAGAAFGVALPAAACRAAREGKRAALWLGPDEWLLITPDGEAEAIREAFAGLAASHALVEVSHRQTALAVEGPGAADLLNAGCPLDLDLEAFPVGMCTRTLLGKAEIVLWREGAETFRVEVARSFAEYAWDFLAEAAG